MIMNRFLEGTDLNLAHTILAMIGFFLSVYVMQLTQWEAEDNVDPPYIRIIRRIYLALQAWAFLWSLDIAATKNWQPWPACLMLMLAVDVGLMIRAIAIKARIKRSGIKPDSPSAAAKLTLMG
jgi:hypothetical protein